MAQPLTKEETPYLLRRDERGVTTLTLNRGDRLNPLSESMMDVLQHEVDSIANDQSVRVVVLAGAGKAFCAGHDLKQMRAQPSLAYYQKLFKQCSQLMLSLQRLPQPVIARVHGLATAAGCQLVATCDLAVASTEASFAASGVNYGLFCSTPAVPLSRNVLRKQAMEMLLTGDFIDAHEAQARGLVNRVVAPEALDQAVAELASSILAKPAAAIAMGKRMFYQQDEMGVAAAYQLAGETMACNMMNDCALEGVQAFIDKRPPAWRR